MNAEMSGEATFLPAGDQWQYHTRRHSQFQTSTRAAAAGKGVIWSWSPITIQPGTPVQEPTLDTPSEMISNKMILDAPGGEDQ